MLRILILCSLLCSSLSLNAAPQPGSVVIDGSSTVLPLSEALAEEFRTVDSKVRVTVGSSGTGGGFKKFSAGETDISNASRPIKKEEAELAKKNKIEYIELEIATDGLTVVVNKDNKLDSITVAELKKIWEPKSTVKNWSDVNPKWPKTPIKLYGPGADSGTFDYFTEVIVGKAKESRSDYMAAEDDNILVRGVSQDKTAMGYFGYAYYLENKSKLKALSIDAGKGAIAPSDTTINNGTYAPLSRPLYIYVNKKSATRPEVAAFVEFTLKHSAKLSKDVGYVALPEAKGKEQLAKWTEWTKGAASKKEAKDNKKPSAKDSKGKKS